MTNFVTYNDEKIFVDNNCLYLQGRGITDLDEIIGLERLYNLKTLSLWKNNLTEIKNLNNLINLEDLVLSYNHITEIKNLDHLVNLKELAISGNKISQIKNISHLVNLEWLYLAHNEIERIEEIENLRNLQELMLFNNKIKIIENIEELTSLNKLWLGENNIGRIENIESLVHLTDLDFSSNNIKKIENLETLINLEWLNLSKNRIKEISGVEELINLRSLHLEQNFIEEIKNLENLKDLLHLYLDYNPIKEIKNLEDLTNLREVSLYETNLQKYDKYIALQSKYAQRIVQYSAMKRQGSAGFMEYYNLKLDYEENIRIFKMELNNLKESDVLAIGTHREHFKQKAMQNLIFFEEVPEKITLSREVDEFPLKIIHIFQIHSLKGVKKFDDLNFNKSEHFLFFIKHFWENTDKVLIYQNLESRVNPKIDEMLSMAIDDHNGKPDLIVLPENSVPYSKISYLKKVSREHGVVIIGGLEHKKNTNNNYYTNQAFIIDKGLIDYQEKQTPVYISSLDIQEKIECKIFPKIKIFATSIGNIAIFICRDFLRLSDVISGWASKNKVDFIVIPSLTNKILPFYSKLLNIIQYTHYSTLKIIFCSVGEYGGSELYSLKDIPRIEEIFRKNSRDNVGEVIVIRKIWELDEEIESDKHRIKIGKYFFDIDKLDYLLRDYSTTRRKMR